MGRNETSVEDCNRFSLADDHICRVGGYLTDADFFDLVGEYKMSIPTGSTIIVGHFNEFAISQTAFGETTIQVPYDKMDMVPALQAQGHHYQPTLLQSHGLDDSLPASQVAEFRGNNAHELGSTGWGAESDGGGDGHGGYTVDWGNWEA